MNFRDNRYIFNPLHPPTGDEGSSRGQHLKVTKHQVLKRVWHHWMVMHKKSPHNAWIHCGLLLQWNDTVLGWRTNAHSTASKLVSSTTDALVAAIQHRTISATTQLVTGLSHYKTQTFGIIFWVITLSGSYIWINNGQILVPVYEL